MTRALRYHPPMTYAELVEIEQEAKLRHELVDGIVYAMVGGTVRHGVLCANILFSLKRRLGAPCFVFSESTKLKIGEDFFYPDAMVCCDPTDRHEMWRERPSVIFEVLSPSSVSTDRNYKRERYAGIPSVTDYVIVEQARIGVEHHSRKNGFEPVALTDGALILTDLGLSIPVSEFYDQIDF